MQAGNIDLAAGDDRKMISRRRRAKGRFEKQASTGTDADAYRSFDPALDKTGDGERRSGHHAVIGCHVLAQHAGWRTRCSTGRWKLAKL